MLRTFHCCKLSLYHPDWQDNLHRTESNKPNHHDLCHRSSVFGNPETPNEVVCVGFTTNLNIASQFEMEESSAMVLTVLGALEIIMRPCNTLE